MTDSAVSDLRSDRPSSGSRCISIAFLTGLVFVPVVIAVGLLTPPSDADLVPADISASVLRKTLDAVSCNSAYGASNPASPRTVAASPRNRILERDGL